MIFRDLCAFLVVVLIWVAGDFKQMIYFTGFLNGWLNFDTFFGFGLILERGCRDGLVFSLNFSGI